MKADIRLWTKA